jgi:RNA polymerase sigma factor (sigma-70 family)
MGIGFLTRHSRRFPLPESSDNRTLKLLEEAYQRYRTELRQFFAHRSRDPHSVDDLIQTMYVSLKKTRPAGDVRDPRQYLFGMAWHLLHNENRRVATARGRSVDCNFDEFDVHADRSNRLWVEDDTALDQQRAELNRVLAQLPPACQLAVLRQYRDNRSYAEIASELNVTTHTVKKYMVKALNHIRLHFQSVEQGARQEGKR